jgi:hypothetical protein
MQQRYFLASAEINQGAGLGILSRIPQTPQVTVENKGEKVIVPRYAFTA